MKRHSTFKFCLNPTAEQQGILARHAGAARFAFNQCLHMVGSALAQHRTDPDVNVPWTGYDLINTFNIWKRSEAAGRLFAIDGEGVASMVVTGLPWRREICQQVFEEAAVDCGRALAAWSQSRRGTRRGPHVRFPRFKKKAAGGRQTFRLRNKHPKGRQPTIRLGETHPRSVTLPGIGVVRIRDDTRRLRHMLAKDRAKIPSATVIQQGGRWWVALNVAAADLHPTLRHPARTDSDRGGWVGLDRGLAAFVVAASADGHEVARIQDAPKALRAGMRQQRRLAKSLSRKKKGSHNRRQCAARLARHHNHIRNIRRHFLHRVSNELAKTHDRLVIEDLNVSGMLRNHRLAQAIGDAGWAEFARQLRYKTDWRNGELAIADRWYPSSQVCSRCGNRNHRMTLSDRVFICDCGYSDDRDRNAAANLARWAEQHHLEPRTPKHGGRVTNVRRRDGADRHVTRVGETTSEDVGTDVQATPVA